ncbi:MAG: NACHT domain-containing protein [Pseudonocardiaceae bacterium]
MTDALLPGVLGLLLVLLWAARQFFGEWVKKAADRSFTWLFSGRGRIGGRRLLGYRKAITSNYGKHALGYFRTEPIDIRTVYVPLQYEGGERCEDVYERIQVEPRTVVVGPAGAGKSLLLKNSMLIWASVPLGRAPCVPVMVDLHRCNTDKRELFDLTVEELHRNRLYRSREAVVSFVQNALRDGRLQLLFDGLDEVGRGDQDRVIRDLRDLASKYSKCKMVVTCRKAVYHGQLAPEFGHVVEIGEFDDASMRRLLGNWPGIQGAGGPDVLFDMLRRNPPLMRLARSPLLLTMMAYLHVEGVAETGRTLPKSRAEFYDKAITDLLGRDIGLGRRESLSVYGVGEKLAALQRIALALQEAPPNGSEDRLAMSRRDLLSAVGQALPELKLDGTHAKPLLDEIVDRSQLLIPLDRSNSRYQFRHLTMQEYLAARELAGDPDRLMTRYRADPDAWRETVKLWCANGRDCTAVVTEVFTAAEPRHRVLALECLADATRIDGELADRIIYHFLPWLGYWASRDSEAIIRGFGAVAADSRPSGNKVLELLTELARSPDAPGRAAAFRALAASGRDEAAQVLVPLAPNDPDARAALRAMGELAIPVLADHAGDGNVWAVDDLAVVGTPAAAQRLAPMLWSTEEVATRAAWRLAELLRHPDVEEVLSRSDNTADPAAPSYDWVWRPFASKVSDAMPAIAGRIAYLLDKGPTDLIPQDTERIDARIGLPVAALGINSALRINSDLPNRCYEGLTKQLAEEFVIEQKVKTFGLVSDYNVRDAYDKASSDDAPSSSATRLAEELLDQRGVDPRYRRMVELLPWPVRAQVLGRLVARWGWATQRQWIKVAETLSSRLLLVVRRLVFQAGALVLFGTAGIVIYRWVVTIT